MDLEITPAQQALVDSVGAVLERECPTTLVRDIVENGGTPEQPWKSAHEIQRNIIAQRVFGLPRR